MSVTWTVQKVCERYQVKPEAVLGWIHSGQLRALNVKRDPDGQRPRWRILDSDLEAFEATRSNGTPAPSRQPRRQLNVKEFV